MTLYRYHRRNGGAPRPVPASPSEIARAATSNPVVVRELAALGYVRVSRRRTGYDPSSDVCAECHRRGGSVQPVYDGDKVVGWAWRVPDTDGHRGRCAGCPRGRQ